MYAVIDNQGKQYKVSTGDEVLVDLMPGERGDKVEFDRILLVGGLEGKEPVVGRPNIDGARVVGEVVRHEKGPKVVIVRYKGPNQTKKGHRQKYTRVRIDEIHPG